MSYYPQPGGYYAQQYASGDFYPPSPPVAPAADWAGWIALILVVIIIIALIIFFVYSGGATTYVQTRWNIITGTTGATQSITGTGGTYYVVSSTSPTLALTVTAPSTNPTGEEFIIDNSRGSTVVTLTVGANTFTIPTGQVNTYVWTSTTAVTLVATSN